MTTERFFAQSRDMWHKALKRLPDAQTIDFWQPLAQRHQQIGAHSDGLYAWEERLEAYIQRMDPYYKAFIERSPVTMTREGNAACFTVTYKDNIDVLGFPTRCGSTGGFCFHPTQSARIVELLHQKSFALIGKVATTEFSIGNEAPCINPLFPDFSPSGSSTGSAVAVAAGFCDLSIGTDSGGSVRWPAGNCGVVGLRLTHDPTLTRGTFPVCPSMDSIGLITRTVADLAYLWRREELNTIVNSIPETFAQDRPLTIGIVNNSQNEACHPDVCQAFEHLQEKLRQAGHRLIPVNLAWWNYRQAGWQLLLKEAYSVHKALATEMEFEYQRGTLASLSSGESITDEAYEELQKLQRIAQEMANADLTAQKYDVLLLPLDPDLPRNLVHPPPVQTIPDYDEQHIDDWGFTILASFVGIPALTLPIAISSAGAPIAVQLFAEQRAEEKLIRAGLIIENLIGFQCC